MEYIKIKDINEYVSENINPRKTPDTIFEMYSVPIYDTGHPEYLRGDEIASNKVKAKQTRNKPAQILLKAGDSLEAIDTNIFKKLDEEQLAEISEQLDRIIDLVDDIRGALDV